MARMRACVRSEPDRLELREIDVPALEAGKAVIKTTLTTICGSDVHLKGTPIQGIVMGHEIVGTLEDIDESLPVARELSKGDRVTISCVSPCGGCSQCLSGQLSACSGKKAGMRYGVMDHGCQAEYLRVNHANANLCRVPDDLTDEEAIVAGDILSTGLGVCERAPVRPADHVAVFAQGPLGLCATVGARLCGAALVIAVESVPERVTVSRKMGADIVLDPTQCDPVEEIQRLTDGRGVDVAVEAVGKQETFESAFRSTRFGGTLSSLGIYGREKASLEIPLTPTYYHKQVVFTFCPSGRERLRRMMDLVRFRKVDLAPLWTHRMKLEEIIGGYDLFESRRDGVLKIAITP